MFSIYLYCAADGNFWFSFGPIQSRKAGIICILVSDKQNCHISAQLHHCGTRVRCREVIPALSLVCKYYTVICEKQLQSADCFAEKIPPGPNEKKNHDCFRLFIYFCIWEFHLSSNLIFNNFARGNRSSTGLNPSSCFSVINTWFHFRVNKQGAAGCSDPWKSQGVTHWHTPQWHHKQWTCTLNKGTHYKHTFLHVAKMAHTVYTHTQ